jgi:hypothetical protein
VTSSDSAWLKIVRASKHLETLKNGIAADATRDLNDALLFRLHPDRKPTLDLPEPNVEIAILAGEIIYHLRSALDHFAFDLVKLNRSNIALPADWKENCAFPTWTNLKPGQTPPLPYGVFKNLPGIPIEAHAIIERVQPYYSVGVANGWLKFLVALSNIDKYRRFALTRTRASYRVNTLLGSGIRSSGVVSLDHGAELPPPLHPDEPDTIVEMERSISLFVAFDERDALGDATGMPIDYFLEQMLVSITVDIYNPLRAIIAS